RAALVAPHNGERADGLVYEPVRARFGIDQIHARVLVAVAAPRLEQLNDRLAAPGPPERDGLRRLAPIPLPRHGAETAGPWREERRGTLALSAPQREHCLPVRGEVSLRPEARMIRRRPAVRRDTGNRMPAAQAQHVDRGGIGGLTARRGTEQEPLSPPTSERPAASR